MHADDDLMRIKIAVESEISTTTRARQVAAMFDVPVADKCRLEWDLDFPHDAEPWNVGLVVGPSGSGKSTVMRHVWGEPPKLSWNARSVVDDFDSSLRMQNITDALSAVGFNTIPAWLRPHAVLSNGEQFRVDLARRILELPDPVIVDEFTSVVDRQVAQFGSHAVQKYVRRNNRKFVAVGCHYDVIDWLQPDWVLDMATRQFTRRLVQRRPDIECVVGRVPYAAWSMFAPFHYMSADLNKAARVFGLWANGRLAAIAGLLHFAHPKVRNIMRTSRLVTLPDFQGMGFAMVLIETVASAYKAIGKRVRTYPAHPALIRTFDRSSRWCMKKEPGTFGPATGASSSLQTLNKNRPSGAFEYVGTDIPRSEAVALIG